MAFKHYIDDVTRAKALYLSCVVFEKFLEKKVQVQAK